MSNVVLEKETALVFPHFIVLKASAGSGKTYALTMRCVQFLLSDNVHHNELRNLLAITFSNNAAKEMKERILSYLKGIYFTEEDKISEITQILSLDREKLISKAEDLIDKILINYTEFQIKTIDSFTASIYKSSAIDLGYNPDIDILMHKDRIMLNAFNLFLRRAKKGTPEANLLEESIDTIIRAKEAYLWEPSKTLLSEIKLLYEKLSGIKGEVKSLFEERDIQEVESQINNIAEEIDDAINKPGLEANTRSSFGRILKAARENRFPDIIGVGTKAIPVKKTKGREEKNQYEQISDMWEELVKNVRQYHLLYSHLYCAPYLKIYEAFKGILEQVEKQEEVIFIADINKRLSDYLNKEIVTDLYFRMGETIYHYLIDEFQDTSRIQWDNLYLLIENSLSRSQKGSLFVVGDTKQAIYGFRDADYRIMRDLESENPFPSAHHSVRELETNYRSLEKITDFNKKVFHEMAASNEEYREPAQRSGLIDYKQSTKEENKGTGYVEVTLCSKREDEPEEREKIQWLINKLIQRGHRYSDIAILVFKNHQVTAITAWLSEKDIPFVSYSSLDIRTRRLTGEIISLLNFLSSPADDLSFTTFLLGDLLKKVLQRDRRSISLEDLQGFLFRNRQDRPTYKAFQRDFSDVWEEYFEGLFKAAGYMPIYDLVSEIYRTFRVFETFDDEEAPAVKVLELIKDLEDKGKNSLEDFIKYAEAEETSEADWNINLPPGINAVRVMTIHKAKGLGFPVVIILLYEEEHHRGFDYIIKEGPDGVNLLKITGNISEVVPQLKEYYTEERLKEDVNGLNALYVGFTRAGRELYVIGVNGKEKPKYPLDILPSDEYQPSINNTPVLSKKAKTDLALSLLHHHSQTRPSTADGRPPNIKERKRGDFIHRVLCSIDYGGSDLEAKLGQAINHLNAQLKTSYPADTLKQGLLEFLMDDRIREYFTAKPGRIVKREQDFSNAKGNLFRVDRVIIDTTTVTAIDYKTDKNKEDIEKHIAQMKNYMGILKDIYPDKTVKGLVAYTALREIIPC
ncbi:UvrD-helicase domain-containing protein [Thermodesulfovibrionales bacterium]|nr:UvrD-helicase domain-containing protein [Thermodesulfovibrionales bacterium]